MPEQNKSKTPLIVVIVIIVIAGLGIGAYFLFKEGETNKNTNTALTNTTNTEATNKTANTNTEITNTSVTTESLAASDEAVSAILEEAKKWATDAEIHYLSSSVNSMTVDGERIYSGFEQGKFATWIVTIFSPSKKQSVSASWVNGKAYVGDPDAPPDDVYASLESKVASLNDLAFSNTSTSAFLDAKAEGLDDTTNFYTMEIPGDSESLWRVNERSRTEEDEYGLGKLINTYSVGL